MSSDNVSVDLNLTTLDTCTAMETKGKSVPNDRTFLKEVSRINKKVLDMEDYMLDRILSQNLIQIRGRVQNPWLKNPLKMTFPFSVRDGKLSLNFESKYLQQTLCSSQNNRSEFLNELEASFVHVLTNYSEYFTRFYKYRFTPRRTFTLAIAIFVIFLAKYLKRKHIVYITEFLVVFACHLSSIRARKHDFDRFIVEQFVQAEGRSIVAHVEQQYSGLKDQDTSPSLEAGFLVKLFVDFLVGHDFLVL